MVVDSLKLPVNEFFQFLNELLLVQFLQSKKVLFKTLDLVKQILAKGLNLLAYIRVFWELSTLL